MTAPTGAAINKPLENKFSRVPDVHAGSNETASSLLNNQREMRFEEWEISAEISAQHPANCIAGVISAGPRIRKDQRKPAVYGETPSPFDCRHDNEDSPAASIRFSVRPPKKRGTGEGFSRRKTFPVPFFSGITRHADTAEIKNVLHCDHPLMNHRFQMRDQQFDLLLAIHNLDHDRQVC